MNFAVSGKSDSIGYFKQKVIMIEILESKRPLLAIVCRNERIYSIYWYIPSTPESGVLKNMLQYIYRILCTVRTVYGMVLTTRTG